MNDKPKNILEAIDEAFSPEREAARRKKVAARKQAEEARLFATPSPTHAAYVAIAKRVNFKLQPELIGLIKAYKLEWLASYRVMVDHQHDKVRAAHRAHELEIQAASSDPEKLRSLTVRSFEDFQAEFMVKLKAANKNCAEIMGKINVLVAPVRAEFANAVEQLEMKIECDDELVAMELGLEIQPSHTVMQLRKAVWDIRNSTPQISPTSGEAPSSIADLVSKK